MKNWLCYYEVHVEDATYLVHVIVHEASEDAAIGAMREAAMKFGATHLQAKGCLGEFTPELARKYMLIGRGFMPPLGPDEEPETFPPPNSATPEMAVISYQGIQRRVRDDLDRLERMLHDHQEGFRKRGGNWGYVGDLNSVADRLREIVEGFNVREEV